MWLNEGEDRKAEVLSGAGVDSLVYFVKGPDGPQTVDAASAFVTIHDAAGSVKVARTAATISPGGKLSLGQAWPLATFPLAPDYFALWEWQVGGVAAADRQLFDVVKTKLRCPVDSSDLADMYPNLQDHLKAIEVDDASRFVRRAWSQLLDRIEAGGSRPSLILSTHRLINPTLMLALAMTCEALSREPGDVWEGRAVKHLKSYEALFSGLGSLTYDRDEDGAPNDRDQRVNKVRAFV